MPADYADAQQDYGNLRKVEHSLPAWFQADEVFTHNGNWYLGTVGSLHIGPYRDRETAQTKSVEVANKLRSMGSGGPQLRYVRQLLHEEWQEIGMAGSEGETCFGEEIELTPPPSPVRHGEKEKNWRRSERFFEVDGVWFFSTREGINVGPYGSEGEAKKSERQLVSRLNNDLSEKEAQKIVYGYKHRPLENLIELGR